MKGFLKLNL